MLTPPQRLQTNGWKHASPARKNPVLRILPSDRRKNFDRGKKLNQLRFVVQHRLDSLESDHSSKAAEQARESGYTAELENLRGKMCGWLKRWEGKK